MDSGEPWLRITELETWSSCYQFLPYSTRQKKQGTQVFNRIIHSRIKVNNVHIGILLINDLSNEIAVERVEHNVLLHINSMHLIIYPGNTTHNTSTPTPFWPHLTYTERDYMILLL